MKSLNLTQALYNYSLDIALREHTQLKALREATAELPLHLMQVSPDQAQFMQMLLRLLKAERVLELGTFTGYSALAMALALPEHGHLITCDINTEWTDRAKPFWDAACQSHKIELRLGRALNTLEHLMLEGHEHSFDFIFIDADKTNYLGYYEYALKLVRPTGLIAIDNIFWEGAVIDETDKSAQTREIRKLNAFIQQDKRVNISLLSIADGLFLIQPKTYSPGQMT